MASNSPAATILQAIRRHDSQSTAVVHYSSGKQFTYGQLFGDVCREREALQDFGAGPLKGERIAFIVENNYDYVVTLLSVLSSGAVALPLSPAFPVGELGYILDNSRAKVLLSSEKFKSRADEVLRSGSRDRLAYRTIESRHPASAVAVASDTADAEGLQGALMLYTSGTTSRPKGVVLPQSVLVAQARSLHTAWHYTAKDHLLHVLPLHHIHGTVNALLAPLLAGATIEFMFPFNAQTVWQRFAQPFLPTSPSDEGPNKKISFFTAVPTIYNRLISSFDQLPYETQAAAQTAISPSHLRVNISGSAALPTPTKQAWTNLSHGNALLERYGMTEVGMALSCGLDPSDRVDGSVGWPLPSVEARLVDLENGQVIPVDGVTSESNREREGEIQLQGPTVFSEYWDNPEATAAEFVEAEDGQGRWFKTGDVAIRRHVAGAGQSTQQWARGPMYFIRGRKSTDIIKTGGEKVSALEIERELLSLPQISEVAVVGIPSEQWGQKVGAIAVLDSKHAQTGRGGKTWGVMDMRRALKDRLANYKVPQELRVLEGGLPRNAMGKVNKKSLLKDVFGDASN